MLATEDADLAERNAAETEAWPAADAAWYAVSLIAVVHMLSMLTLA